MHGPSRCVLLVHFVLLLDAPILYPDGSLVKVIERRRNLLLKSKVATLYLTKVEFEKPRGGRFPPSSRLSAGLCCRAADS